MIVFAPYGHNYEVFEDFDEKESYPLRLGILEPHDSEYVLYAAPRIFLNKETLETIVIKLKELNK